MSGQPPTKADPTVVSDLKMPSLGKGAGAADILKVLVSEGDQIAIEQAVIEVETDKATVEVPSELAGKVLKLLVAPGEQITTGQAILSLAAEAAPAVAATIPPPAGPTAKEASPSAQAAGTGYGHAPVRALQPVSSPLPSRPPTGSGPVFASPSVRGLAREIGVDIYAVAGSGPSGRISAGDVKAHARQAAGSHARQAAPAQPPELPDFSAYGPTESVELSRLRRTIARNLGQSWTTIPHVTLHARANISELQRQRARLKETGVNASVTAILIQKVVAALQAEPALNASFDASSGSLVQKGYWNIGIAVDTDRGLVVPVVRSAERKDLARLAEELADLAGRARRAQIKPDELAGASFTITNLGTLGISEFTPIINPPEVAILGVGTAETIPVWADGAFAPQLTLPLSLSIDHRAVDGADGARFLTALTQGLADPGLVQSARPPRSTEKN